MARRQFLQITNGAWFLFNFESKLNQFLPFFSCRKSNPPGRSLSRSMRSCSHLVKPVSQLAKPRVKADSAIQPHLETTTWQQQQQHQRQCQQHERQNNGHGTRMGVVTENWGSLDKIRDSRGRQSLFYFGKKGLLFLLFFFCQTHSQECARMRAQGFVIYFNKNLEYFKMNFLSVHIGFLSSCYACFFAQMFK